MKKEALALLVALTSSPAFASSSQQSYEARAIGKQPAACPVSIMRVAINTKPGSIESQSLRILMSTGAALSGDTKYHSRSCQSDIICEGYDVVDMPVDGNPDLLIGNADSVEALITHNNDGEYPTTDKRGFKEMQLLMMSGSSLESACYYDLVPAL